MSATSYRFRFGNGTYGTLTASTPSAAITLARLAASSRGGTFTPVCAQCDAELHPRRTRFCQPCASAIAEPREVARMGR